MNMNTNKVPGLSYTLWPDLVREVDVLQNEAEKKGFKIETSYYTVLLRRPKSSIWLCSQRWAVAYKVGLVYRNHRYFRTLKEALESVKLDHA
jgi:hypothetical protein